MKVTKAQAQANRAHVVETASALFRERGYDGVSVADLMAAAGFTHGGFYKQFRSKADLMAEAAACGIAQIAAQTAGMDLESFLRSYLSRAHRDTRASGCTFAALSGDAARQTDEVRAPFAEGIASFLESMCPADAAPGSEEAAQARAKIVATLAGALGALVLSRACPDESPLADEILETCRESLLATHGLTTTKA